MIYWLASVAVVIVGLAHWINGRVNPKAYFFLPFLFLAPSLTTLDLSNSLGGLGVALVLLGSVAAYVGDKAGDKANDDRDKKRMAKLAAVGFGATILGAAFTYVDQIKSDNKNEASQEKITSLGEKNVQLSQENRELLRENANYVTGGDSILYIEFIHSKLSQMPRAVMQVKGNYDLPNVTIEYYKLPDFSIDSDPEVMRKQFRDNRVSIPAISVVAVGGMREVDFKYPEVPDSVYIISLMSGRKSFAQLVYFLRKPNGDIRFAYRVHRVLRVEDEQLVLQLIPELSYTDSDLSPTGNHIVPELDFPERFSGMKFVK